jgi:hypothetical protein
VQFSRDGLFSQLFPHRDWRANLWAFDIVNSPRSAKKASAIVYDRASIVLGPVGAFVCATLPVNDGEQSRRSLECEPVSMLEVPYHPLRVGLSEAIT